MTKRCYFDGRLESWDVQGSSPAMGRTLMEVEQAMHNVAVDKVQASLLGCSSTTSVNSM